jgi:hypothetical protein
MVRIICVLMKVSVERDDQPGHYLKPEVPERAHHHWRTQGIEGQHMANIICAPTRFRGSGP